MRIVDYIFGVSSVLGLGLTMYTLSHDLKIQAAVLGIVTIILVVITIVVFLRKSETKPTIQKGKYLITSHGTFEINYPMAFEKIPNLSIKPFGRDFLYELVEEREDGFKILTNSSPSYKTKKKSGFKWVANAMVNKKQSIEKVDIIEKEQFVLKIQEGEQLGLKNNIYDIHFALPYKRTPYLEIKLIGEEIEYEIVKKDMYGFRIRITHKNIIYKVSDAGFKWKAHGEISNR